MKIARNIALLAALFIALPSQADVIYLQNFAVPDKSADTSMFMDHWYLHAGPGAATPPIARATGSKGGLSGVGQDTPPAGAQTNASSGGTLDSRPWYYAGKGPNFGGNAICWTNEYVIDLAQSSLQSVSWYHRNTSDGNNAGDQEPVPHERLAVRVGGQWFLASSAGLTRRASPGTAGDWWLDTLPFTMDNWFPLDFSPDRFLDQGIDAHTQGNVTLPKGVITAFGLYEIVPDDGMARFDTFCIQGQLPAALPANAALAAPIALAGRAGGANDRPGQVVYHTDFKTIPGEEWSQGGIRFTPKGHRPYWGDFYPVDTPTLALDKLPPHKLLRLDFNLLLSKSWDGSAPQYGPSVMHMELGGDDPRSLLHATFSNMGMYPRTNNEQTFPDNYLQRPYPAFTLAAEKQTLGFMQNFSAQGGHPADDDPSAVYHLVMTFPHADPSVLIRWKTAIRDGSYKGYGFTSMQVKALPELKEFTNDQFAALWTDLGRQTVPEAEKFDHAKWELIAAGDAAVSYIANHRTEEIDDLVPDPATDPLADRGRALAAKLFPLTPTLARLQRARDVLDAVHTPAALALKAKIPPYVPPLIP